jgi:UDP-glucose 4-epimerase
MTSTFHHRLSTPQYPSRVVLLGANGFIAKHLNNHLIGAGINSVSIGSDQVDLTSAQAVDQLINILKPQDTVVMLAAITPDKGNESKHFIENLLMMHHLVQALEVKPVSHLVYFSSDAVYGPGLSYISEASPASPQDLYGVMHLSREKMVSVLDIPSLILRVTMVYGIGDTHNSYGPNRFWKMANKDKQIVLFGMGEEKRDHIHINDVITLTELCLTKKTTGLLNLATGFSTSFLDVAKMIKERFPGMVDVKCLPRAVKVTHRYYDTTNLIKAFPSFDIMRLAQGISLYTESMD